MSGEELAISFNARYMMEANSLLFFPRLLEGNDPDTNRDTRKVSPVIRHHVHRPNLSIFRMDVGTHAE